MHRTPSAAARDVWFTFLLLAPGFSAPAGAQGQATRAPAQAPAQAGTAAQPATATAKFKEEDLVQLTAPIALYPDDLVSQVLMASTYPLEVIEAYRFTEANKNLKGDALAKALNEKKWDPSVKSLVQFPSVLKMMNDKLDWTQKLGDAFLAQQKEVLDTIQKLRAKAHAEGNLKTNAEQKVVVEKVEPQPGQTASPPATVIKIESAQPQVVYVPTYNPTVVYGTWPYPAYPPYYYTPPGYVAAAGIVSFGVGFACGAAWGYAWGGCNWGHGDVDIDINKNVNFNSTINRNEFKANYAKAGGTSNGKGAWQHDASHRKGVNYRDSATAQKYGKGASVQQTQARESFRGRAEQGRQGLSNSSTHAANRAGGAGGNRAGGSRDVGAAGGDRAGGGASRDVQRPSGGGSGKSSAFQASGSGRQATAQADRGRASRSSGGGGSGGGGRRR